VSSGFRHLSFRQSEIRDSKFRQFRTRAVLVTGQLEGGQSQLMLSDVRQPEFRIQAVLG
jgi:hypothetical protein